MKSGGLWVLLVICGVGVAVTFLCLAIYDAWATLGGGGKHAGLEFLQSYAAKHLLAGISIFGSPIFIFLAFVVANKVAMQTVLFGLWSNKAVHHVEPVLRSSVESHFKNDDASRVAAKLKDIRSGLIKAAREDSIASKITIRVINHAIKKVDLDGIDPYQPDLNIGDVVTKRVVQFVEESTAPSLRPFWILIAVQVGVYVCSKVF